MPEYRRAMLVNMSSQCSEDETYLIFWKLFENEGQETSLLRGLGTNPPLSMISENIIQTAQDYLMCKVSNNDLYTSNDPCAALAVNVVGQKFRAGMQDSEPIGFSYNAQLQRHIFKVLCSFP